MVSTVLLAEVLTGRGEFTWGICSSLPELEAEGLCRREKRSHADFLLLGVLVRVLGVLLSEPARDLRRNERAFIEPSSLPFLDDGTFASPS